VGQVRHERQRHQVAGHGVAGEADGDEQGRTQAGQHPLVSSLRPRHQGQDHEHQGARQPGPAVLVAELVTDE
jgi:hypothetical protein